MLGGHVDLFFGNVSGALALWRDGKLKVLAVLDKTARRRRCPTCRPRPRPACPSCISTGWFAAGRPAEAAGGVAARRSPRRLIEVLKMPDVQQKFRNLSVEPGGRAPARDRGLHQERSAPLGRSDQEDRRGGGLTAALSLARAPLRRALLGERGEPFGRLGRLPLGGVALDQVARTPRRRDRRTPPSASAPWSARSRRGRSPAHGRPCARPPPRARPAAPPGGRGRCGAPPRRRSARRSAHSGASGARRWRR